MDRRHGSEQVLKLVNLARATYGASELEALPGGELHSAPFCPIGRSLRRGAEDWLFVTVGSKHLRLWAAGKDPLAFARQIMTAWKIPFERLQQSRDRAGMVMFSLPSELQEFIEQFDRGLLPDHEGQVDQQEARQLRALASSIPVPVKRRNRDSVELRKMN